MDRRSAALEDLPPLELRPLRDRLDLGAPDEHGESAHVAAASGVVRRGDFVYVIGDDELFLSVFRLSSQEPGRRARVFEGELAADHAERKAGKPDLEALTVLPPTDEHPYGALLGLGSGSKPTRDRGFLWGLAPDGSLARAPAVLDLQPLYGLLRERVEELNVEGAAVMGDQLWLLHRGNGKARVNAIAELVLDEVLESLVSDRTLAASELQRLSTYDLGALDGARLTFSDATPLADHVLVFTASAERSEDTYADGEIAGSVVGTIDGDGEVRRLRAIDPRFKVEGVHASIDTGVVDFLFVCDQDDPSVASPLLSAAMPLDATPESRGGAGSPRSTA